MMDLAFPQPLGFHGIVSVHFQGAIYPMKDRVVSCHSKLAHASSIQQKLYCQSGAWSQKMTPSLKAYKNLFSIFINIKQVVLLT